MPLLLLIALSLLPVPTLHERMLAGTAWVVTPNGGKGTGFLLDSRRLVTCHHVVAGHDTVDLIFPTHRNGRLVTDREEYTSQRAGVRVSGRVIRSDRDTDLAVVELTAAPAGSAALPLARRRPVPGEPVVAVGCRRDLDVLWTFAEGPVRQTYRTAEGYFWSGQHLAKGARVLATQVPSQEGDSGGPVVNLQGEVVGVTAAVRWQARLVTTAIDVAEVRALAGLAEAPDSPSPGQNVYARAMAGVALVRTPSSGGRATAFVVSRDPPLLLTAASAVGRHDVVDLFFPVQRDGQTVSDPAFYRDAARALRSSGQAARARVLARDEIRNVALLEIDRLPAGAGPLLMADAGPRPGAAVHHVGNPVSAETLWVYAGGSVRQLGRARLSGEESRVGVVFAQLPLSDGDAGGPLLDERGRVVAMASGKDAPQQLVSYALDLTELSAFLRESRPLSSPTTAADFRRRAALMVRLRQWSSAEQALGHALRLDDRHAPSWADRSLVRLEQGNAAGARVDAERALRLDAGLPMAHVRVAAAILATGDLPGARRAAAEALRLDPRCADAFTLRATVARLSGEPDQAISEAGEAVFVAPNFAPAYRERGLAHRAKGNLPAAASDLARAVSLDPLWLAAARECGDILRRRNESKQAIAAFDLALAADPDDPVSLVGRGLSQAPIDKTRALSDLIAAARLSPRTVLLWLGPVVWMKPS